LNYLVWLITAIHLLSVVLWIGGTAFILITLRPAAAALDMGAGLALHGAVFRRFFRLIWQLMPIAIIAGLLLRILSYSHTPLPWPVSLMQGVGILMGAIFVGMALVPARRFQAKLAAGTATEADVIPIRRLLLLNLVLGTIILISVASL
jgi:uncharacterized membrane protein